MFTSYIIQFLSKSELSHVLLVKAFRGWFNYNLDRVRVIQCCVISIFAELTKHEVKKLMKVLNPNEDKHQSLLPKFAKVEEKDDDILEADTDIRYIPCHNLFASDVVEKTIQGLNLKKTTMTSLLADIQKEMKCDEKHTVELFSSEGYPMNQNSVTGNGTFVVLNYYYYKCK